MLLGDAGVGKSVMAGVLAQRMRRAGNLGAAYFCRHNDSTRNNPRYLLGTIACQLCKCNSQYNSVVGGEGGIRKLLGNSELGIQELFTKLLLEPLAKCNSCHQRKLVVIDGLDETKYESRESFLDLIMNRFPMLPQWLVFFITSRPEDTVQFTLNNYNPCIRICAGNSENPNSYQQHEQDIKLFLEKSADFSRLPFSVEDVAKTCNGLFLYAFYVARLLTDPARSSKIDQLIDLCPRNIESFFLQNFKRVFDKVGPNVYKKLFGCAIVAPSPLPVSFISFILRRENSNLDQQEVIDAVSLFEILRTPDETFTFLHNLIPAWLTDKTKASRKLFIDKIEAGEYLRIVIVEFLSAAARSQQCGKPPSIEGDLFEYYLRFGVRFLCGHPDTYSLKIVFNCLTSYQFIWKRIQKKGIEIYSVIGDLKLSVCCHGLGDEEKGILQELCVALERSVHVLVHCPHLLHCCLHNESKDAQKNVLRDGVSEAKMKCSWVPFPASKIPPDVRCSALSPDKTLLAGGKGKFISLFDACTLEKVQGPTKVTEMEVNFNFLSEHEIVQSPTISHLEFSSDGKFLFFGRLDKWFCVEQGCVEELPQFAGNGKCYKWGSFISGTQHLVVQRDPLTYTKHNEMCLLNLFYKWAWHELCQMKGSDIVSSCSLEKTPLRSRILRSLCQDCNVFERSHQKTNLALVRQRVIDLYPELFEYQIWDVKSGKPVLEESFFSDGVQLSPFFLMCHLATFGEYWKMLPEISKVKDVPLCTVAFVNANFYGRLVALNGYYSWLDTTRTLCELVTMAAAFDDMLGIILDNLSLRPLFRRQRLPVEDVTPNNLSLALFGANTPVMFLNHVLCTGTPGVSVSLDRKWMVYKSYVRKRECEIFLIRSQHFHYRFPDYFIENVKHCAFMEDSSVFLYYTGDTSLHALRLHTGAKLLSASGLSPFFSQHEKQVGYVFVPVRGEETIDFLKNLPRSLCRFILFQSCTTSLEAIFIPAGTIPTIFSKAWKTIGNEHVNSFAPVKTFVFSKDSNLIAIHQGTEICVFDCGKFLYSLCKDHRECDVSYLAFSSDSTLLLYCIQNSIDNPRFYVWDVQNMVFAASFDLPIGSLLPSIDCCCLSSDNTKLVIYGRLMIEIWEYAAPPCRCLTRLETSAFYSEVDKFTWCTVSLEHNLQACCIIDRIVLFPLNAPTGRFIRQLPRAHLGKIEFCQFLKGNRYLISYGVDGTVFLWDLMEWRPVAFANVVKERESIVSLYVSHEEEKVVCLTSVGRLIVITLCGLEHTMLSTLMTPEVKSRQSRMVEETRGLLGQQHGFSVKSAQCSDRMDNSDDLDVAEFIEEIDFMLCSDNSEDGDDGDDGDDGNDDEETD